VKPWPGPATAPMSVPESQVLQHLCALDESSSEFLRTLYTFMKLLRMMYFGNQVPESVGGTLSPPESSATIPKISILDGRFDPHPGAPSFTVVDGSEC